MKKILQSKLTVTHFLAITIFFISPAGYAQSTIHGKVWKSINEPAIHASVLLLRTIDSSLVKATICSNDGDYEFNHILPGSYMVSISLVGYQSAQSPVITVSQTSAAVNIGAITMIAEASALKQVTVVAKKPLLEQQIDRLVINVAASITSAGNTALEVLERAPGVTVDHQNNAVSMNGKNGVVLMMNGKISRIPVSALVQLLESTPAGTIEKIELITTPPASLDAEGNAGYINIVLKENNNYGTNGSVSATAGYGRGWVTTANMNINNRKGRVNLYGDISYSRFKTPLSINSDNITSNNGAITETVFGSNRVNAIPTVSARAGMDVELAKHTVMGVLVSGYDNNYIQSEHNTTTILKNGRLDTLIQHYNSETNHWINYAANINLQHDFNKNGKLFFNLNYIHYQNNQPVNYHSAYFSNNNGFVYDQFFRSSKRTPIHFWGAALDYTKKLTPRISMEAGIKQTLSSFNNDIGFERLQQTLWTKDNALSAVYTLKEDYAAAYTSFNFTISKTTEGKAGLRYEHTNSNLGTAAVKNIVDRHYGNFFPSVFITHKLSEVSSIDFSYSRRITRPTYNALAPFTYYANANTVITGNPALQPSISDNLKAGFTYKKYLFSFSYSFDDKAISGFQPESDSVTNKFIVTPQNLINQKTASFILSLPFTITPWWSMQYNVTALWQRVNALYKGTPVSLAQVNFNANAVQRFTLPKNFSAEVSGFYQSAMLLGLSRTKPIGSLDIGLKKKLPGKGGSLLLNATNILNTSAYSSSINLPEQNLVGDITFLYNYPTFKFTYTRSFGKEALKEKRDRKTGVEEEKNRVQ